ncbi:SGNH/GDSL hydrolase family protein [Crenobacter caeni]|uniref:SGNH/GDSL hydrolase family protein n=1 Tax=Crenobacter caeni TaxID=2705474 RepID=A0A6B2KRF3_9NEIS|nr:SGNH/GDSL hydrolase family protein [Crenobacter caeni]NDV12559.1 SGNH/GDSL hydrolase family protein [Crenobacter caeni]
MGACTRERARLRTPCWAYWPLAPLLAWQGQQVRQRTPKLPEPAGEREGEAGEGTPLSLLIVGDSSAAGVGVASQADALSGQLLAALAPGFRVRWQLRAQSGLTSDEMLAWLAAEPPARCDVAVSVLGVNDVTSQQPLARFVEMQRALVERLQGLGARRVLLCALPPMQCFPALPAPLAGYLGARARRYDAALAALCAATPGCRRVGFTGRAEPGWVASDGFHPGAACYRAWGGALARSIIDAWPQAQGTGTRRS